jgi:hypothetical protein
MKLPIQGNLLRLRLTQKEVARLHDHNVVECAIQFPSGRAFSYLLASSSDAPEVFVDYEGDCIRIVVPRGVATALAESSEVTLEGSRNSCVQILIEKDFQCLHKPADRDPDAYPNPLTTVKKRPAA